MNTRTSGGLTRLGLRAYLIALVVIVLDQLSKFWILLGLFPSRCPGFVADASANAGCSVDLLPVLSLSMVWNRGVSFGLLQAQQDMARWGLALFSAAVAVLLILWAGKVARPLLAAALGLVIGGAIGNLIDRVRLGAVADFIDVSGLGFFPWVFNVADSAITVGVVLLVLDSFLPNQRRGLARA